MRSTHEKNVKANKYVEDMRKYGNIGKYRKHTKIWNAYENIESLRKRIKHTKIWKANENKGNIGNYGKQTN